MFIFYFRSFRFLRYCRIENTSRVNPIANRGVHVHAWANYRMYR